MRSLSKISITAGVLLLALAVAAPPAQAQCSDFPLRSAGEFLVSNPNWQGGGGFETCTAVINNVVTPIRGCFASDTQGGPISPDIQGFFWALGTGNPEPGMGNDSGEWAATRVGDQSGWTKAGFLPALDYYYPGWLTLDDGPATLPNYFPGSIPNWTSGPADGCIDNRAGDIGEVLGPNNRPCQCLLLLDQWGDTTYFLLVGNEVDATFGGNFGTGTPGLGGTANFGINAITFEPLLKPDVSMSSRQSDPMSPTGRSATVTLNLPAFSHRGDTDCNCFAGYRVYTREVLTEDLNAGPIDNTLGPDWTERTDPAGPPVGPGILGLPDIPCDPGVTGTTPPVDDTRLAIAVGLELADGFGAPVLSQPQFFQCDPDLAEPNRPGRRPFDPRPDRGRDSDRPSRRGGR